MEDRPAKGLMVLFDQVGHNKIGSFPAVAGAFPKRKKGNDGWIASAAHHAANPSSDHEADSRGIVHAIDITHDPANGFDSYKFADWLLAHKDPRIKYIISNGRIGGDEGYAKRNGKKAWTWYKYTGDNSHSEHVHISINKALEDDERPWVVPWGPVEEPPEPAPNANRQKGIVATIFGGIDDAQPSAYGKGAGTINDTDFYVSLPDRFEGKRPKVRVFGPNDSAVGDIRDVGPWNTDDPYWTKGTRPQAESGTDTRGRKTNKAGIDLSPALAKAVGISKTAGKGLVDWEFVTEGDAPVTNPTPAEPSEPSKPEVKRTKTYSADVARLQKLLGFSTAEQDGYFGLDTEKAVKWFQRRNGLDVDGIVGDQTWETLEGEYKGD